MGELTRIYPSTAKHMSRSVSKQPKRTDHHLSRKFVLSPGDWQAIFGWVCIMLKVIIRLRKRVLKTRYFTFLKTQLTFFNSFFTLQGLFCVQFTMRQGEAFV